jgi:hypothetical protein
VRRYGVSSYRLLNGLSSGVGSFLDPKRALQHVDDRMELIALQHAANSERGVDGALRVVFVRDRRPEERH